MENHEKLRQMIQDLGRALAEAISDSSDASRTLRHLHHEGYAVSLALGPSEGNGPDETSFTVLLAKRPQPMQPSASLNPDGTPQGVSGRSPGRSPDPAPERAPEPTFQIRGRDLAFLRSIGIDPTRRPPRRRR